MRENKGIQMSKAHTLARMISYHVLYILIHNFPKNPFIFIHKKIITVIAYVSHSILIFITTILLTSFLNLLKSTIYFLNTRVSKPKVLFIHVSTNTNNIVFHFNGDKTPKSKNNGDIWALLLLILNQHLQINFFLYF